MKKPTLAVVALLACLACATPPRTDRRAPTPSLLPEAKGVVVVDAAPAGRCKAIGSTNGGRYYVEIGDWNYPGVTESYVKYARIEALNQAALKGATHVVYEKPWTFQGRDGNRAEYVAALMFVCEDVEPPPAPAETSAPAVVGCTKDTDCKGNRICENAKCVEPPAVPPGK